MSIQEWLKKKEIKMALLVFLLVLCAFGIGYIMGHDSSRTPIVIENN